MQNFMIKNVLKIIKAARMQADKHMFNGFYGSVYNAIAMAFVQKEEQNRYFSTDNSD